jgi:hypothetical protein
MLRGQHADFLRASRLTMLNKVDGTGRPDGYRPICVREVIALLPLRAVAQTLTELATPRFAAGGQWAFAADATGRLATSIQTAVDAGYGAATFDVRNAFNSPCRASLVDVVCDVDPAIGAFVAHLYQDAPVATAAGPVQMQMGVPQGCPVSMVVFALLMARVLCDVRQRLQRQGVRVVLLPPGADAAAPLREAAADVVVAAYADDVNVAFRSGEHLAAFATALSAELATHCMSLAPCKTRIVPPATAGAARTLSGADRLRAAGIAPLEGPDTCVRDAIKVVGIPVGATVGAITQMLGARIDTVARRAALLQALDAPFAELAVWRVAGSASMLETTLTAVPAAAVTAAVRARIRDIDVGVLRHALRQFGLGPLPGASVERAFLPPECSGIGLPDLLADLVVGPRGRLMRRTAPQLKARRSAALERLKATGDDWLAGRRVRELACGGQEGLRWMMADLPGLLDPATDAEIEAVANAYALGVPVVRDLDGAACPRQHTAAGFRLHDGPGCHLIACAIAQQNQRHDAARDALADYLTAHVPADWQVRKEQVIGLDGEPAARTMGPRGRGEDVPGDVVVTRPGGRSWWFDVTICAADGENLQRRTATAAQTAYDAKLRQRGLRRGRDPRQHDTVAPFAMSSLGSVAQQSVQELRYAVGPAVAQMAVLVTVRAAMLKQAESALRLLAEARALRLRLPDPHAHGDGTDPHPPSPPPPPAAPRASLRSGRSAPAAAAASTAGSRGPGGTTGVLAPARDSGAAAAAPPAGPLARAPARAPPRAVRARLGRAGLASRTARRAA